MAAKNDLTVEKRLVAIEQRLRMYPAGVAPKKGHVLKNGEQHFVGTLKKGGGRRTRTDEQL